MTEGENKPKIPGATKRYLLPEQERGVQNPGRYYSHATEADLVDLARYDLNEQGFTGNAQDKNVKDN